MPLDGFGTSTVRWPGATALIGNSVGVSWTGAGRVYELELLMIKMHRYFDLLDHSTGSRARRVERQAISPSALARPRTPTDSPTAIPQIPP